MQGKTLLRLLQISDSAFPTGSFFHSMGLEAFAERAVVSVGDGRF